jgi:hypothetical protein
MAALAKQRTFLAKGPGRFEYHRHDREASASTVGDCGGPSRGESLATWDADATAELSERSLAASGLGLVIECDLAQKTAKVQLHNYTTTKHLEVHRVDGKETYRYEQENATSVFDELRLADDEIVMELKESPGAYPDIVNYYGVVPIPFTFGRDFRGIAHLSWSVTRRLPPK